MIALDTNILARFYVNDPSDPESITQRPIAHRSLTESPEIFVPLTVLLELEWVLRAFYGFAAEDFVRVVKHLMGLANVQIQDWAGVTDALHLLASSHCKELVSFDDKRFARRAKRMGLLPTVVVPLAS